MRTVAENSFARVLNPHRGAYILSSTDRLFRCITTLYDRSKVPLIFLFCFVLFFTELKIDFSHKIRLKTFIKTKYHHHHVVSPARISLTLSRHFSLSFITSGRSSGLHPVSSQSCCMYVRAGRPTFARPYVGVHKSTSLMSSSLLLWIV